MSGSRFVYVTYIRTTPDQLWHALTTTEFMKDYFFGVRFETEWKQGAPWQMVYPDGVVTDSGEIVAFSPPHRLELSWRNEFRPELKAEGYGRMVAEIEPVEGACRLTITHTMDTPDSALISAVSNGWPQILANLKSLIETGSVVLTRH